MLCIRCRSWLQKQMHECCQHCFRGSRSKRSACRPRRKPLLKLAHKKACKQFAEDNLAKSMNYCNHVLWSDESKVNLFDSDGVQHGGSIMVLGCMTTAGTGELRFIEGDMDSNMYCDILKKKMMSSLQKLFSNITTPNTPPRWQLPCCWRWRWWSGQVCLQTWTLLSTCGASSSGRWRSTMCLTYRSSYVSMEKWKRMPATTCAALVNSMPRRIKAVLDNNGAPTKYWHFEQFWHVHLGCTHFCCQLFGQ